MKPQLGDTISNRYVLVSPLREETGLQVWKASDHVLARDCQLFIVSSSKALQEVNATASMLAISHDSHFTKVLQLQHAGQVALVVTQLDEGMTLSEYLALNANQPLSYTAMRSIIGEVIESLHALQKDNLTHFSISTDTVRLTRSGIQIADAPVSIMLADTSRAQALENREQLAIRQISALLYAMLIRRPSTLSTDFRLEALAPTTPMEFRVICKRGLELEEDDGFPTVPMATIAELEAFGMLDRQCSVAADSRKGYASAAGYAGSGRQHSGNDVYRSRTSHRFFRWQGGFGERRRGHQWSGEIVVEQRP